jgi:hypothetical protein
LSYGYPGTSADETKRLGVYHGSSLSYIFGDVGTLPDAAEGDLRLSEYIINGFVGHSQPTHIRLMFLDFCLLPTS